MVELRKGRAAFAVACLLLAGCSSVGIGSSARVEKAKEMMAERCKRAGEKIHRTVPDVEGILVLKVRPVEKNFGDQFALTDPYGNDMGGDDYIASFITGSHVLPEGSKPALLPYVGYRYVEVVDPTDGRRYRYTGRVEEPWQYNKAYLKGYTRFVLEKSPAPGAAPRYGVTYEDISTREEREHWIAASSLRVVDLQTNEIVAERIGFMVDPGQGSRSGGRSPWLFASEHACPSFQSMPGVGFQVRQTARFVERVLLPIGKE